MSTEQLTPAPEPVAPLAENAAPADPPQNEGEKPEPKELTEEQRQIRRLERNLQRALVQRGQLKTELEHARRLTPKPIEADNQGEGSDSEPLTLSRAELQKLIESKAREIAPRITEQETVIEQRRRVIEGLTSKFGQERFDQLAGDLDSVFDGFRDGRGNVKPAVDAVFEAKDPAALIEYLADPEHADEAEALARMSPVKAGMRVAELAAQLAAKKPKPSQVAAPLEPAKASGTLSTKRLADLVNDPDAFAKRRREQMGKRH